MTSKNVFLMKSQYRKRMIDGFVSYCAIFLRAICLILYEGKVTRTFVIKKRKQFIMLISAMESS